MIISSKLRYLALVPALALLVLSGCKKDDPSAAFEAAEDNSNAKNEFESLYSIADDVGRQGTGKALKVNDTIATVTATCATAVITSTGTNTWTATVDFGPDGCLCSDGVTRRGTFTATFTGGYRTVGSTLVYTAGSNLAYKSPFTTEWVAVQGARTFTYVGPDGNDEVFTMVVNGAKLTYADGSTTTWNENATVRQVAGQTTPLDLFDDEFHFTGTTSGTNRKGDPYTGEITQKLIKRQSCLKQTIPSRQFLSGKMEFESEGNTLLLDFDPENKSACDSKFRVVINGDLSFDFNIY